MANQKSDPQKIDALGMDLADTYASWLNAQTDDVSSRPTPWFAIQTPRPNPGEDEPPPGQPSRPGKFVPRNPAQDSAFPVQQPPPPRRLIRRGKKPAAS
jgi:hypothetical protein